MEILELMTILAQGEDSAHQFKKIIHNEDSLASEMVAFSNANGGKIIVGVSDDGSITGLTKEDVSRLNQLISNVASQNVKPAINPYTQNLLTENGLVLIIHIPVGMNKPYQDKNGVFWVKNRADKRKATAREEIQRLFQMSGLLHADQSPVNGLTLADLDMDYFRAFFQRRYNESLEAQTLPLEQTISNMNLGKNGILNLTAALLFARNPSAYLPVFIVKAVCFPGDTIAVENYQDSRDIQGKMADIFQQTLSFIQANLKHKQEEQFVNSLGIPEIPRIALEELLVNALIHRDYFISAPIRVFVFNDRVEIISPGHLPNNLTIANIKAGNSNARNPILTSFATQILPYRGIGSGILRALKEHPNTEFIDDRDANLFKAILKRIQ
ncbi:RNA-binding domain-containing protein [Thioflexithrix psekupsensis]|uniref:ATP-dependent DNA helicase RecG n=1 Tax=Thioflexithrix psekupsensis TaxID=1570016 RepID=A0A251X5E2_9GAMM|nr:RNA-binding domain-containing protein [Thioflexithrix psekupsensis]OUD12157.1 ATP-dependent DNA helicase RecG [Thioflexithrix psekupsensis]